MRDKRFVKTTYMTNIAGNDTLNCIYYTAADVANDSAVVVNKSGNYASGLLFVTRMENEDGQTVFEFEDKTGQVLLTRQIHRNGSTKELFDTYYIYDAAGLQQAVLPPLASDVFKAAASTASWNSKTDATLKIYAYLYKYDKRKRCIAKKLPGSGWNYYVYDFADRLVFSQDGEQRKRAEWTFTIPDQFGRPCLTGTCKNSYNALSSTAPLRAVAKTTRDNSTAAYKGYTNLSILLISPKLLTVNYYDDYAFLNKAAIPEFNNTGFGFAQETGFDAQGASAKTLPTGVLTAQLDDAATPTYLGSVMYYNATGQMIQSVSSNHLGAKDKEHVLYNFTGTPKQRKHVHTATGKETVTENYAYTYDHAGRLKKTTHQLTIGTSVKPLTTLVENTYDELGRLASSKSNDQSNLNKTYTYNIRSWIQKISNPHFTENLTYHYSGDIKTQQWIQAGKTRNYTFGYDGLSRLKSAVYSGDGSYGTSYTYDKHGNITALSRYGNTGTSTYGIIDNLTMGHVGNQLIKVEDSGVVPTLSSSADFRKYNSAAPVEYTYDANGNMKSDRNKGITNITYNLLNLPRSLSISNSLGQATNTYLYTADGRKLSVSKGSFNTDYVGNIIYESGTLKRILVDNGYYENGIYYFYINDHLGNNRIVTNQSATIVQSTQYYPFGMAFADGVEPSKQPYKYNGKELDSDRGLNLYDYEWRQMDPALNRFPTMDPLAEKYYSISPYVYCLNNPVKYVDPTGKDVWVKRLDDGTYEVIGGNLNDDKNIYIYTQDKKGNYTIRGESIGESLTEYSFFSDKGKVINGATINPADNSGVDFLNNEIVEGNPSLTKYVLNARNGKTYDFKDRGSDNLSEGISISQHHYRGMPLNKSSMVGSDGQTIIYGSARDVGNMGAGYVAGKKGLTWQEARFGFDLYQSWSSNKFTTEGQPTQRAERVGWGNGHAVYWFIKTGMK